MIETTLITIHGFWSSPATWDRLDAVWSADERLRGVQIHPFGYPSPKKPRMVFSPSRIPDYDDIAQTFVTEYAVELADAPAVAIVTHSQGGLVLQRFLAWMVQQGRARELARIVSVVMLVCPNNGSDYVRSLRHALGYRRHPQAGSLELLDKQVADAQRTVLQRIVNATRVDDGHECRIPFHVYAGASDRVVVAASAQAAFPGALTLGGNHFSILDPAAPGNRTAEAVTHHLVEDLRAWQARTASPETRSASDDRREPDSPRIAAPPRSGAEQSVPRTVEGPFAQAGNITLEGDYVAGHDIVFGKGDESKKGL
jgi:pimeloyl-ACP methyl ester carboxylesterase